VPPPSVPASSVADQLPARAAVVWAALDPIVGAGTQLRVLDVGGGSGNLAVPLARLGHDVTVVDPSADALATLARRAANAGVGARVHGVQGDGDLLHEVVPPGETYDLALCHSVLDIVDDPATTLRELARALRPAGTASITAANRAGAVLARAVAGHPVEALALVEDRDPAGWAGRQRGVARPARRRFTPGDLLALVTDAGLEPGTWRGVAVVADLLDVASEVDPAAVRRLELALGGSSPYREVAAGLHVLATRP
jgi:S-adenosylmethionine-dependent methyltransferase